MRLCGYEKVSLPQAVTCWPAGHQASTPQDPGRCPAHHPADLPGHSPARPPGYRPPAGPPAAAHHSRAPAPPDAGSTPA
jgi:hypothetical protein